MIYDIFGNSVVITPVCDSMLSTQSRALLASEETERKKKQDQNYALPTYEIDLSKPRKNIENKLIL